MQREQQQKVGKCNFVVKENSRKTIHFGEIVNLKKTPKHVF